MNFGCDDPYPPVNTTLSRWFLKHQYDNFSFSLASEVDKINLTEQKIPMALKRLLSFKALLQVCQRIFFFISLAKEKPHWIHKLEAFM